MKIYYAHHIWKYDTEIETYELNLIVKNFSNAEIINPNRVVNQNRSETDIMSDCFNYVRNCDAIIFSSLSGIVCKGVVDEVTLAKNLNKKVYYIFNNSIKLVPYINFEVIKNSDSNRIYAIVKHNER